MRLAVAIAVVAVTWSAAVFVHQRKPTIPGCNGVTAGYCAPKHPAWEDPMAVLIALGGVAIAAGILTIGRPS